MWDTEIKALKMARKIKPNHGNGIKPYVWTEHRDEKKRRSETANELRMCWKWNRVFIFLCSLLSEPKCACACPYSYVKTTTITTPNEWHLPKEHILFDLIRFGWACFDTKSPFVRRNIMTMLYIGCAVPTYACIVCSVLCALCDRVSEILKWAHKKLQQYFFTLLSSSSSIYLCWCVWVRVSFFRLHFSHPSAIR